MLKFLEILGAYCTPSRYPTEPKAAEVAKQNAMSVIPYFYLIAALLAWAVFLIWQGQYLATFFVGIMFYTAIGDLKKALRKAEAVFLVHHLEEARVVPLQPHAPLPIEATRHVVFRDTAEDLWYCAPPLAPIVYGNGQYIAPGDWTQITGYDEFNRRLMDLRRLRDDTIETRKDVFGWLFLVMLTGFIFAITVMFPV